MKVTRRGGRPRLRLDPVEGRVLDSLLGQLADLLEEPDEADEVVARLFPDGHREDAEIAESFRELTRSGLLDGRRQRIADCRAQLEQANEVDLDDPGDAQRWLQTLNDLRLTIGTRLGVTADHDGRVRRDDPQAEAWNLYHWLTAMQDSIVVAVSG